MWARGTAEVEEKKTKLYENFLKRRYEEGEEEEV